MHDSPFDSSEQAVLANSDFFLTKAAIDAKINALFGELKTEIEHELNSAANLLPIGFPATGGRIYRGEHHGPFPWRAVDCPAGFHKDGFLAFRTLLLWGHHFSFHLLISGKWLEHCRARLLDSLPLLHKSDLRLSVQKSIWEWDFNSDTHVSLADCTPERIGSLADENRVVKLSRILPLDEADLLIPTGLQTWRTIQNQLFLAQSGESPI